jgi:hypothetical protein
MLEKVPADVALRCWPYMVAKSSHTGADVDGLAYPLHHSTICMHQMRGQRFLPGAISSRHVAVGGGALLEDVKPPVTPHVTKIIIKSLKMQLSHKARANQVIEV